MLRKRWRSSSRQRGPARISSRRASSGPGSFRACSRPICPRRRLAERFAVARAARRPARTRGRGDEGRPPDDARLALARDDRDRARGVPLSPAALTCRRRALPPLPQRLVEAHRIRRAGRGDRHLAKVSCTRELQRRSPPIVGQRGEAFAIERMPAPPGGLQGTIPSCLGEPRVPALPGRLVDARRGDGVDARVPQQCDRVQPEDLRPGGHHLEGPDLARSPHHGTKLGLHHAERLERDGVHALLARHFVDQAPEPLAQAWIVRGLRTAQRRTVGLRRGRESPDAGEGGREGERARRHRYGSAAGVERREEAVETCATGEGSDRGDPCPSCWVATSVASRAAARCVTAAITLARSASRLALRRREYTLSPPSGPPATSVPFSSEEISSCNALSAGSFCWQVSGERKQAELVSRSSRSAARICSSASRASPPVAGSAPAVPFPPFSPSSESTSRKTPS